MYRTQRFAVSFKRTGWRIQLSGYHSVDSAFRAAKRGLPVKPVASFWEGTGLGALFMLVVCDFMSW